MIKTDKSLTEAVDMKRGVVLATMGMLVLFLVAGCNKRDAIGDADVIEIFFEQLPYTMSNGAA